MDIEDVDVTATAGADAGSVGNVDDFSNLASLDLDLADDFSPEVPAVTGEDDSQPVDTGDDTPPVPAPDGTQELQQQQQQQTDEVVDGNVDDNTPPAAELTHEQYAAKMAEDRQNALNEVAKSFETSLTDDEREALLTEPARVIPTLLARAQVQAFESAVSAVFGQLPMMLDKYLQNREVAANAEAQFFSQYGEDLRPHTQDIQAAITLLRQKNPKATREQISAGAAQMVRSMHKLQGAPAPQRQTQTPAPPAGTAASRAPVAPTQQKPADDNPFAMLAGIEDY